MLAVLFGNDWEKHEGDVTFEKGPMEAWVHAIERMLNTADAVDPLRIAIGDLVKAIISK